MTALSYFLSLSQLFVYSSTKGIGNSLGFSFEDPALALLILTGASNQNKSKETSKSDVSCKQTEVRYSLT